MVILGKSPPTPLTHPGQHRVQTGGCISPSSHYPQLCTPPSIPPSLRSPSSPTPPSSPSLLLVMQGWGPQWPVVSRTSQCASAHATHFISPFLTPPPKNPQQDLVSQKPSGGQEKLREFPEVRQLVGAEDGARVVGAHPSPAHMMSKAPSWGQSLRHLPTHPTPFPTGTCPVSTSPVIPLAKLILWKYRRLTDVSFLCTGNAMRFLSVNSDFSHSCHPLPFLLTG